MSGNEGVLYQKGQISGTSDEDVEDVWDDRLLIEAYDRAVRRAEQLVADSLVEENEPAVAGDEIKRIPKAIERAKSNDSNKWKEGMFCRCVYSEDNLEYEATIKSLSPGKATCRVVYHGYNNEEEVPLARLKRTKGEKARQKQKRQSEYAAMQQDDSSDGQRPSEFINGFSSMEFHNSSHQGMLPPPPPPQVMSHFPKDESDALSAMLMSWYMSGYHTGYYQGLTRCRSKEKGISYNQAP